MRDGRPVLARSPKRRGSQTKHKTVNSDSLSKAHTWGFRNPQTYFFLIQLGADAAAAAAPGPGGRPRRSAARDRAAAPERPAPKTKEKRQPRNHRVRGGPPATRGLCDHSRDVRNDRRPRVVVGHGRQGRRLFGDGRGNCARRRRREAKPVRGGCLGRVVQPAVRRPTRRAPERASSPRNARRRRKTRTRSPTSKPPGSCPARRSRTSPC